MKEVLYIRKNKARLVAQGYTQEEGIDYDEVFGPVARIEAIRLFLAYASYKDFVVYQMDVKSAFLYGKIEEEVYVCQPLGFEDPNFPDRVYKVEKTLYGLHQAPRAWYETLSTYLLDNSGLYTKDGWNGMQNLIRIELGLKLYCWALLSTAGQKLVLPGLLTTASVNITTAKPITPPTTTTVFEDEDLIISQTLMKMRSEKSKAFGGNTRDLGSFGEETDKTTDLHQHLSRMSLQWLETASQIQRDAVTTKIKTASPYLTMAS
ncbi:putative ribonuclease H-like domain-containing protein [Tanacetum coccineum]